MILLPSMIFSSTTFAKVDPSNAKLASPLVQKTAIKCLSFIFFYKLALHLLSLQQG
jgi:hypothetical protein